MRPNYPRNCWYVAARSDEVGRNLLARRLLDRPVVLYREESGTVVALEDRCAHRAYPLSKGRLEGDQLVCGYHGFVYDSTGACVRVPSQPNVAYGVCIHAFPVREQPLADWEAEATGLPRDRDYTRHYQGTFLSPAVTVESWDIDDGSGKLYSQARIQAVSPESPASTHLFWEFARNYETERELVGQHLNAVFEPVMRQDVAVLETIQAHAGYEAAARGARVSADAGVLKVRAIVSTMLANEAGLTERGTSFRFAPPLGV